MSQLNLEPIKVQLTSANSRERLMALAALVEFPAADVVPLIKKVLYDEMLPVRSMAVFILKKKQTEECYQILVKLLESDLDYGIRAEAAGALGYIGDKRAFEVLQRAFYEDTSWLVRFSAAVSLGNLQDARAKTVLLDALNSPQVNLQLASLTALGEIQALDAIEPMLRFAGEEDWLLRHRLAQALGNLKCNQSISALKFLAKDVEPQVRQAAMISLQHLQGTDELSG